MNPEDRFKEYKGDKCWQAYISEVNRDEDLRDAGLTEEEASMLRIDDFVFEYVDKGNKELCNEIKDFIVRHEWIGNLPNRPTHRFTARLKKNGVLAGTIIMAIPNMFSNILGGRTKRQRKANLSWCMHFLGSKESWIVAHYVFNPLDGSKYFL